MLNKDGNIDISKLDKASVLANLYNNLFHQGMGILQKVDGDMTTEQAQSILDTGQTYFDYLRGKIMKVNLEGAAFDPYLYDRNVGQGQAERVINQMLEDL